MILVSNPGLQNKSIEKEISSTLSKVLKSGWYILGQEVDNFEKNFAAYCGTKYCVGVGNGTEAITISLLALNIGPGDEVICPSLTATFTALAISASGATPVFVDIDPYSLTIDPTKIEAMVTKNTKAIIPVHLYGQPAALDEIISITNKYGLNLIEDACQAHGALYKNNRVGSIGDIGCFSFYPTKNLGALGDGGAITTNSPEIFEKVSMLRNGGQKNRYIHELMGRNSRLDEIQAAILSIKLKLLDEWNKRRNDIAELYNTKISNPLFIKPNKIKETESVHHLYVLKTDYRDQFMEYMKSKNIQTQIHYPVPSHLQPIYKNQTNKDLPATEDVCKKIVSLPIYPELSLKELDIICTTINEFYA